MTISIVVRGNAAIKKKGGHMIANFIPKVHSFEKRKVIMKKIFESFYKDANYQDKLIFLYFVSAALRAFSRASLRYFIIQQT